MHVMRHLPISGDLLPLPKIERNIMIIKGPVKSFNFVFPQVKEDCIPEIDSQVQKPKIASTVNQPVNSVLLYCCSICMKGFCEKLEWKAHVEEHSKTKSLICNMCFNGYIKESAYEKHLKRHSPKKPYSCNTCWKSYSQCAFLLKHQLTHKDIKRYRCAACTAGFLNQESLEMHLKYHGCTGVFCNICEKTYNRNYFDHHFCGYSGKKPKICHVCGRVYFCLTGYNYHVQAHAIKDPSLVETAQNILFK